jgi:hypothetical protein
MTIEITAPEFAEQQGVDPKSLRRKLRKAFPPPHHQKGTHWKARIGSPEHRQWLALAAELKRTTR